MSKIIKRKTNYKRWKKLQEGGKKKHVETMFLTTKLKKHKYYYKPTNLSKLFENNPNKYKLKRNLLYIRSLNSGYITIHPLKAIIRLYKWFIKNYDSEKDLNYRLFVFPDFVLTSKPKEVRMGKGKGANLTKVDIIKKNQLMLFLRARRRKIFNTKYLINLFIKKMAHKLPFHPIITKNNW